MLHLIVEEGASPGTEICVPEQGLRFGRAVVNDLVFEEPGISQVHGRFLFKSDGRLWVTDFGNPEPVQVNGEPIMEAVLRRGDLIRIGNTVLRVVHESRAPSGEPATDPIPTAQPRRRPLWRLFFFLLLAGGAALLYQFLPEFLTGGSSETAVAAPLGLEFRYEKVNGGPENIFRYALTLEGGVLQAQVDDLKNGVQVARREAVPSELLQGLARTLENTGFFGLLSEYTGAAPGQYNLYDLSLTLGFRHHRVKVFNRLEPDGFKAVRQMIEEFGNHQLGLAVLSRPPAELRQMASDAFQRARKAYDERAVNTGRLPLAERAFEEVLWLLETIEPKPDYYSGTVMALEETRNEISRRYQDGMFEAERAIRFRDWNMAAERLRMVLELVPDRTDERHRKAQTKLIDVERRIK